MKVKKYVAGTMPEAMNLIRKDLGPDAVILNSREIKQGGFLGLFQKTKIEVYAILDELTVNTSNKQGPSSSQSGSSTTLEDGLSGRPLADDTVLKEINYLKKLMEQQVSTNEETLPPVYQLMHEHLMNQEVSDTISHDIMMNVMTYLQDNHIEPDRDNIFEQTRLEIESQIKKLSFDGIDYKSKVVNFVGPTGVGKTTTLAKLAAKSMLDHGKSVAFVTTDTYRIAAIEQLKTYADILSVPLEVAYSADEYDQAIDKLSDYDLILVDTPGRNFREDKYISNMKETLSSIDHAETYLVLSLTAKPKDLTDIQKQFQQLPIKEIIFTKLDETTQYGSILTIAKEMDKGIAYLTNGQDVPDDLWQPAPKKITDLILGDIDDE